MLKRIHIASLACSAVCALAPAAASATVIGFLGNFDVINDTGHTAHGFEIELEGLSPGDITDTFGGPGRGFPTGRGFGPGSVERYGSPTITLNASGTGTLVTYRGLFDGTAWDYGTPYGTFITPGDNCWSGGGVSYGPTTPCDHFGVGTSKTATKTTYNWLTETAPNSGVLSNGLANLPAPAWNVVPAAPPPPGQPPAPPVVGAVVVAPAPIQPPGELEPQWGDAIWVKVFTTELEHAPRLEDLVRDNPVIANLETEVEWQLLQKDPGDPLSGVLEKGYGAPVGPNAASIIRRYEFYDFGGSYDEVDHHAILVGNDSNPGLGDVGHYLGAQNGAVNLAAVPEPGSVGMMAAGLGFVIAALRRRGLLAAG